MNFKVRLAIKAVKIRLSRGEKLEDILLDYSKLTEIEKEQVRKEV